MENSKQNIFDKSINIISWLKIAASPLVMGVIIAFLFKLWLKENVFANYIFSLFILAGAIIGIFWANKESKKYGSSNFISRVNASPDIDAGLNKKP